MSDPKEFVKGDSPQVAIEWLRNLTDEFCGPSDRDAIECLAEVIQKIGTSDLFESQTGITISQDELGFTVETVMDADIRRILAASLSMSPEGGFDLKHVKVRVEIK